jgi:hypothetical protein
MERKIERSEYDMKSKSLQVNSRETEEEEEEEGTAFTTTNYIGELSMQSNKYLFGKCVQCVVSLFPILFLVSTNLKKPEVKTTVLEF